MNDRRDSRDNIFFNETKLEMSHHQSNPRTSTVGDRPSHTSHVNSIGNCLHRLRSRG